MCKISAKMLNSVVVGAGQSFQFFQKNNKVHICPEKSWNLKSVLENPGKSCDLLIFMKSPGNNLEFSTVFV